MRFQFAPVLLQPVVILLQAPHLRDQAGVFAAQQRGEDEALLVIFNDLDLIGKVTGDPLAIKAFI